MTTQEPKSLLYYSIIRHVKVCTSYQRFNKRKKTSWSIYGELYEIQVDGHIILLQHCLLKEILSQH